MKTPCDQLIHFFAHLFVELERCQITPVQLHVLKIFLILGGKDSTELLVAVIVDAVARILSEVILRKLFQTALILVWERGLHHVEVVHDHA